MSMQPSRGRHFYALKQLLRGTKIEPRKEEESTFERVELISDREFAQALRFMEEEKFNKWYDDFAKTTTESPEERALLVPPNDNPSLDEPIEDAVESMARQQIAEDEGYEFDE